MSETKIDKEKIESIKKKLERYREPGTFDRYNDTIFRYLNAKFPDEPLVSIQEAATYIAYETAVLVMDMQDKSNQALMETYSKMYQFVFEENDERRRNKV